ncbi:acyl carrier protein [Peptoniphilus sp. KCTC 25270]|uniref:acyl carrier protein n=1 Tax=Peptoniphilus sp. KCTC 25270 TaxID=2897414 RepID=UPI001E59231B|nr:acyl carrier protein [Peptoniphilus sp. KCTC 25270]MCD1147715.1 acyl carrier protein [Peptoniphilus sp. KCTC 25270]
MTQEQLKELICENFGNDKEDIQMESTLQEDLGLDSLDAVELSMAIEEQFGIEIPDEDFANLKTFGDLLEFVSEK